MIKIGYSVISDILQTERERERERGKAPALSAGAIVLLLAVSLFLLYPAAAPPPEAAKSIRKQAPPHRGLRPTPLAPPGATTFAGISALSKSSRVSGLIIIKLPCNEHLYCLSRSKIFHKYFITTFVSKLQITEAEQSSKAQKLILYHRVVILVIK